MVIPYTTAVDFVLSGMHNINNWFIELNSIYIVGNIPEELQLANVEPASGKYRTVYGLQILQTNDHSVLNELQLCTSLNKSKVLVVLSDFAPFSNEHTPIKQQELIGNGFTTVLLKHLDFLQILEDRNLNMSFDPTQSRYGIITPVDGENLQKLEPSLLGYKTLYDGTGGGSTMSTLNYEQLYKLFLVLSNDSDLYKTEQQFREWFHCTLAQDFENKEDPYSGEPLMFEKGIVNGKPIHLYNTSDTYAELPRSLEVFGYYKNICLEDDQLRFNEELIRLPDNMCSTEKRHTINRTKTSIKRHNNRVSRKFNVAEIMMDPPPMQSLQIASVSFSVGHLPSTSTSINVVQPAICLAFLLLLVSLPGFTLTAPTRRGGSLGDSSRGSKAPHLN